MISVRQFNRSNIQFQSSYLNKHGECLNICLYKENSIVALFDLHGYYVEVYYDQETNMIKQVSCFKSLKKLEPFLKLINIDEIILLYKAA